MDIDEEIAKIKGEENPIIKSRRVFDLYNRGGIKLKSIAEKLGISSVAICNLIRIRKLPEIVLDGYYSQNISLTHLFIISRLHTEEDMVDAYEKVLAEGLTTVGTDDLVREKLYQEKPEGDFLTPAEKDTIKRKLTADPDIDFKLIQTRVRAKVIISVKGNLKKTSSILRKLTKG